MQPNTASVGNIQQVEHSLASVPTIQSVYACGCSSAALSSSGHVYVWGSNDANNLGLRIPHPSRLPYWELGCSPPRQPNNERLLEVKTFDSQHNVLLPRRLEALVQMHIEQIIIGPGHMWHLGQARGNDDHGSENTGIIERTLFEVQHMRQSRRDEGRQNRFSSSAGSSVAASSFENSTTATPTNQTANRRILSPSSTMPTDDEDDATNDNVAMSASMPAMLNGGRGIRRSSIDDANVESASATATATATATTASVSRDTAPARGNKRYGRRHSDSMLFHSKNRQFSLPNLLRRLGGNNRKSKDKDRGEVD